jgi:hypothetical protein
MQSPESAAQQNTAADGGAPNTGGDIPRKSTSGVFSGPLGIMLFLLLFGTAAYLSYRTLMTPDPVEPAGTSREFFCAEAQKPFEYSMNVGETYPVLSPYSHKKTGYPVEKCYWTRDGKRKREPTYVILNEFLGKNGDTICPDCGRIVVGHNPAPPDSIPLADGK